MKRKTVLWMLVGMLLFPVLMQAKVRLPKLISDGVVLQRNVTLRLWGWADARERVIVQFLGRTYQTRADKDGKWKVTMLPAKAGGPHTLRVNDITVENVMVGEVWLCSGQSNMETPMARVEEMYPEEVAAINNPMIRHFKAPLAARTIEMEDLSGGEWLPATQANIRSFSATAYFFAESLYEHFKVPIGLYNASVGGSPIEAWLSEDVIPKTQNLYDWNSIYLPGVIADKGIPFRGGNIELKKTVELPSDFAGKEGYLRLGTLIDSDSTWVNGKFVGATAYQYPPRKYHIPPGVLRAGKNEVKVDLMAGPRGGFVEDKPYKIICGDRSVDLTGLWQYNLPDVKFGQNTPNSLFNGMIVPVLNFVFKGVLWYQGESNTNAWASYGAYFKQMVEDYRTQFKQPNMPYIYVQLPNYEEPAYYQANSSWAAFRNEQRKSLSIPYTGMVVALGLGEWNDIHPLDKLTLGERIGLEARRVAYGETTLVSNGPLPLSMEAQSGSLFITFTSVGSGIYSNQLLRGFYIAGADGKYVQARATPVAPNKVRVWSAEVLQPVSVRYAWAQNPEGANLKNKEGFPAGTFEMDLTKQPVEKPEPVSKRRRR